MQWYFRMQEIMEQFIWIELKTMKGDESQFPVGIRSESVV